MEAQQWDKISGGPTVDKISPNESIACEFQYNRN